MLNGKYKAIVSDIDGTLTQIIPNALPSDKVTQSIKKATDNGLVFSMASGRPFSLVKYLVKHLGNVGPCICDNGAVIVGRDGSVLWEANLSGNSVNIILEFSKLFKLVRVSCEDGVLDNPKQIPISSKVRKISVHDILNDEADTLINKVILELKNVTCVKASSYRGNNFIDVYFSDINATKQYAVFKLTEILGITRDQIIGVGDGYNDFSLLMACGLKVAMGNAIEDLKAIADYIAPSIDEDGLVDVLNKYYFITRTMKKG